MGGLASLQSKELGIRWVLWKAQYPHEEAVTCEIPGEEEKS